MFKKYLLLDVTGGGIILEDGFKANATVKEELDTIKKTEGDEGYWILRGGNLNNPIPYTTLSNMLISLAGGIPVPTVESKRKNFLCELTRPTCCDEAALNSYYRLTTPVDPKCHYLKQVIGVHGNRYSLVKPYFKFPTEFFLSEKFAVNSNSKVQTTLYFDESGKPVSVQGKYDFQMLLRLFNDNENHPGYKRMIEFISELLGVDDVRKYYHFHHETGLDDELCMCKKLHGMSKNDWYNEKLTLFYDEMKELWDDGKCQSAWFYAIFGYGKKSETCNTSCTQVSIPKTYLRVRRGNKTTKVIVNGQIIVPITDEKLYNAIMDGKGWCTFLDGGMCRVSNTGNVPEVFDYEEKWSKIS